MRSVNSLIKPASSACNLRCRYCFYEDEAQNRAQACMGRMDGATAEKLIDKAFDASEAGGTVAFAFQGGEPTVAGLPFFEAFTAYARAHKPPKVNLALSIQTNGTLLDKDWAAFLKREGFLVGISLDGYRENHNTWRLDTQGQGTWSTCVASLELLKQHRVDVNALCVVTSTCARHPKKAYESLKKLGFDYIQFIACLDPLGEPRGGRPWSLTPQAYGKFLCQLFDLWYRDWETGQYHSIRLFDDYIHILLGDNTGTCATCGRCGGYFVAEADGSLYPCDFYVLDQWKLGTLDSGPLEEIRQGETYTRFFQLGANLPEECHACQYAPLCHGGCKNDWIREDGKPRNYYCASFRSLFDYALPRMLRIAKAETRARHQP